VQNAQPDDDALLFSVNLAPSPNHPPQRVYFLLEPDGEDACRLSRLQKPPRPRLPDYPVRPAAAEGLPTLVARLERLTAEERRRPPVTGTVLGSLAASNSGENAMSQTPPPAWNMHTPLFYLSENQADAYTIGDSFTHNLVLGQTGSGKSITTARVLLYNMARAQFGGLLPCVKVTDAADYLKILRAAGRERDVIHVTLDRDIPFRLNFLEYEHRRSGKAIDQVLVHLVTNIQEVIERGRHSSGGDPFWRQSTNKLNQYGLTVLRAAGLPLSLPSIFKLAIEAPTSLQERDDPQWRQNSFLYAALKAADESPKSAIDARDLEQAANYFLQEHPRMGDQTRGSVLATFSAAISPFLVFSFTRSLSNIHQLCP
jgi:hypothetical protein